ncbi:MAG: hypothetical protein KDD47_04135, partial [Acidobacteria bacterium]|nr:hypothetical protein [Acidobacteriota bacterium]
MRSIAKTCPTRRAATFTRILFRGLVLGLLPWIFALPWNGSESSQPAAGKLGPGNFVYQPLTISGDFQARFLEDRDHVTVIELAGGSYDRDLAGGGFNSEPRAVVAQEFFLDHPDEYDFLMVFTTFEFDTG